jgi:hypothetical protein
MTDRKKPPGRAKKVATKTRELAESTKKGRFKSASDAVALAPVTARVLTAEQLFDRIVSILEEARGRVVRSVNSEMVLAYWHIGREIVEHLQSGDARAEYGQQLIEDLSSRLTKRYGKGFSTTNLRYFRTFFQVYARRTPEIRHMAGGEFKRESAKSASSRKIGLIRHTASGVLEDLSRATYSAIQLRGFSAVLGWSHYRALIKFENDNERLFYEIEAEKEAWPVAHLERQIHSLLFARL